MCVESDFPLEFGQVASASAQLQRILGAAVPHSRRSGHSEVRCRDGDWIQIGVSVD